MKYKLHHKLVLRFPLFSLGNFFDEFNAGIIDDIIFKEALFVASTDFIKELDQSFGTSPTQKLIDSIHKYYNRMSYRSTPFGLFSACAVIDWGNNTQLTLNIQSIYRRSRLDKEVSEKLAQHLVKTDSVFENLVVSLNNTIYLVGEENRVIERSINGKDLIITSFSFDNTFSYIKDLITRHEGKVKLIIENGIADGYSRKQILDYLKNLWNNQIIRSNLELGIPSQELLAYWIKTLNNFDNKNSKPIANWIKSLNTIQSELKILDKEDPGIGKYERLFFLLNNLLHQAKPFRWI